MSTGRVMTVRGPISARDLGITLMHEHVFIDLALLWDPPTSEWQEPLVDAEITLANRGLLQVDPYVSRRKPGAGRLRRGGCGAGSIPAAGRRFSCRADDHRHTPATGEAARGVGADRPTRSGRLRLLHTAVPPA